MKKIYLMAFIILACGLASATMASSPSKIDVIVFEDDSGPLPPEYQWQSSATISIDHSSKSIKVRYVNRAGCYACSADEMRKKKTDVEVKLKGDWYVDFQKLFSEIKLCNLGEDPKKRLVGAGDSKISIKGAGLNQVVKSGEAPDGGEITFREYNVCSANKGLWDELWMLDHEAANAALAFHGGLKPRVYGFYKAKGDTPADTLEIRVDYLTRTAEIWGASRVKPLDKDALRKFETLASSVNYYADKEIKDKSGLTKYDGGELFFDRGEGTYYPIDGGGIADPVGKDGNVKALKDFYYTHNK